MSDRSMSSGEFSRPGEYAEPSVFGVRPVPGELGRNGANVVEPELSVREQLEERGTLLDLVLLSTTRKGDEFGLPAVGPTQLRLSDEYHQSGNGYLRETVDIDGICVNIYASGIVQRRIMDEKMAAGIGWVLREMFDNPLKALEPVDPSKRRMDVRIAREGQFHDEQYMIEVINYGGKISPDAYKAMRDSMHAVRQEYEFNGSGEHVMRALLRQHRESSKLETRFGKMGNPGILRRAISLGGSYMVVNDDVVDGVMAQLELPYWEMHGVAPLPGELRPYKKR